MKFEKLSALVNCVLIPTHDDREFLISKHLLNNHLSTSSEVTIEALRLVNGFISRRRDSLCVNVSKTRILDC